MYQIMVLTYPLIGNCGVSTPGRDEFNLITYHESERIVCAGLVVGEYSEECNHWNSMKPLSEWLVEWNIPAICGIDTRSLTKYLSKNGSQLAKIICNDMITNFREQEFFNPNLINLNDLVTVKVVTRI
jgi:carbamoylphosphate synthase small subunit